MASRKARQINVRMTAQEMAKLERLAAYYGVSKGEVMRRLIRAEADEQGIVIEKEDEHA